MRRLRPSVLSAGVAVILIVVSVVGFALTEHSTSQQEQALLRSDVLQASAYASTLFDTLGSSLASAASAVQSSGGSPAAFEQSEKALSPLGVILVKKVGTAFVVSATVGKGFHPGQILSGDALATVAHAGSKFSPGPVNYNGHVSTARFAIAVPDTPGNLVVYEQFSLKPFTASKVTAAKPFEQLKVALYGSGQISTGKLLVATTRDLPLSGPVAQTEVEVGTTDWTLVAAARHPLIGSFANAAPILVLVLGLLIALIVGMTVEMLHRRHRFTMTLVEERTADLQQSLQDLQSAQDALVQSERLSAVGEMAVVVGHELRNPLAAVTNALYLIRSAQSEPVSEMLARNLTMAERETQKAATLAEDLLSFVRPREMEQAEVAVDGLVEEVVSVAPPPEGIELVTEVEPYTLVADRGQLAEILTNLVTNGYQAMPEGGTLRISSERADGGVRLVVEDNGPGIDEDVANRVFEPFFTTKYNGTGLGLAIVHRLVTAHGGQIAIENVSTGGARVTVILPLRTESEAFA